MDSILEKSQLISNQISCVRREISMRKAVYPRLVASGKKPKSTADYEIACMIGALQTLMLAERSHLNRSCNRPQDAWQPYPEAKPSSADVPQDFLVCCQNPHYIDKLEAYNTSPRYMYTVLAWDGNTFINPGKLDICAFRPFTSYIG